MAMRSHIPRLVDIIEAIERVAALVENTPLPAFEQDWRTQWLVERGIEIISEASRHLNGELKARHPDIPWKKVAGIGNVLRHEYGTVAAPIMWALVRENLPQLRRVCELELTMERSREKPQEG